MTCRELHSRFEDVSWADALGEGSEVAEHTAGCAACRGFVEEQRQLRDAIHMVRESASTVPESVNAAVLAAYRSQWAEHRSAEDGWAEHKWQKLTAMRMPRPRVGLVWVLVAAVALVAMGLLFISRKHNSTAGTTPAPTFAAPAAHVEPQRILVPSVAQATKPRPSSMRKHFRQAAPTISASNASAAPVANFHSLMYCDALICTQEMDVIRVQLPVASIGRPVDFVPASGMVNAEVLIGPDGVARGIRIEQ